ncbi:MAG: sulfite exporter TauE/SafE family protein [Candidatus Solibacter sp.]
MPLELGLVFLLGLMSSLHCVQMCGPIVLAFSLPLPRTAVVRAQLGYNAGRILTYTLLGAFAGAIGSGIGMLGRLAGVASGARIFAGAAMILAGILMIGLLPSSGLISIQGNGIQGRFARRVGRRLLAPNKFTLGITLGFLPCGLVYAALLKAVDTGSALHGALTMLAFGAGTAIALFILGSASSFVRLPRWSNRVAACCMLLAGAILIWRGLTTQVCHG